MAGEVETVGAAEALWTSKDIILGLGTGVVAGIAGYVGAYLKKDAEIKALSKNITELKNQQVILTDATEKVRKDIEHQVWKKQELHQLKRKKIEQYFVLLEQSRNDMYAKVNHDYFGLAEYEGNQNAFEKACMIQNLYLPEILIQHAKLLKVYNDFTQWIANIMRNKVDKGYVNDSKDIYDDLANYNERVIPLIVDLQCVLSTLSMKLNGMDNIPLEPNPPHRNGGK